MAQTLTKLLVHVVFSTKQRRDLISAEIEDELFAYVGGICRAHESPLLAAGGTANHVHLLLSLSKNIALSGLIKEIKKDSSKWIKTKSSRLGGFQWQEGYGAFSIGESQAPEMRKYISNQSEHHKRMTFEEELARLVEKHGMTWNPRFSLD